MRSSPRKIVHVDMDAFYASVEQRDDESLRGRPVIVGGRPRSRGVVCAASYEARRFGVRSAMPAAQAFRLCPEAVFIRPDFARYKMVSAQIRSIFLAVTDRVEPLSLDEAYLDVTENSLGLSSGTLVARWIRAEILNETGLTASAGVAPNKFLAKVASDMDKPDGLTVISPAHVEDVLLALPVRRIPGVGPVTEARCHRHGIKVAADFRRYSAEQLDQRFGHDGRRFYQLARGIDTRPVVADRERKSLSIEDTFERDLLALDDLHAALERLAEGLEARLRRADACGRVVTLKVKYADFEQVTRSRSVGMPTASAKEIYAIGVALLGQTQAGRRPIRLLGIGLSKLRDGKQLVFPFGEMEGDRDEGAKS